MNCQFCQAKDIDPIILLPIKKDDKSLDSVACLKCAKESDHYCKDHERPHIGFENSEETACLACIEQVVSQNKFRAAGMLAKLKEALPADHFVRLQEWGEMLIGIIDDSLQNCCVRALATKAARLKIDIDEMINQVSREHSIDEILPETVVV